MRVLVEIALEQVDGTVQFPRLLERDRGVEEKRGERLLVIGREELGRGVVPQLPQVEDLGFLKLRLGCLKLEVCGSLFLRASHLFRGARRSHQAKGRG